MTRPSISSGEPRASAPGAPVLIRRAREVKGLTQRELGERVGLSQSAVCRLESGGLAPPPDLLARITHVLDLPADALCAVFAGAEPQQWRQWVWASPRTPNEKLLLLALLDRPDARSAVDVLIARTGLGTGTVRSLTERLLCEGLLRCEEDPDQWRTVLAFAGYPGQAPGSA